MTMLGKPFASGIAKACRCMGCARQRRVGLPRLDARRTRSRS